MAISPVDFDDGLGPHFQFLLQRPAATGIEESLVDTGAILIPRSNSQSPLELRTAARPVVAFVISSRRSGTVVIQQISGREKFRGSAAAATDLSQESIEIGGSLASNPKEIHARNNPPLTIEEIVQRIDAGAPIGFPDGMESLLDQALERSRQTKQLSPEIWASQLAAGVGKLID